MEKPKSYEITPTPNGYIVRFVHEDKSYNDGNKRVAVTLNGVVELIKVDLNIKEE